MEKIAIVCCYNDKKVLDEMLINSLNKQTNVEIELVLYNNQFKSAAEAYNNAIKNTSAEYLAFIHQDMALLQDDFLFNTIESIKLNKDAIYGLCGSRRENNQNVVYSNVFHGIQNTNMGVEVDTIFPVDGLDEVFIAFHRQVTEQILFDEEQFDGWHAYAEDLSIQAKLKNLGVFVLPYNSQHKCGFEFRKYLLEYRNLPQVYFKYLKRLRRKYGKQVEWITCPCFCVRNKFFPFWKKYFYRKLKAKIFLKMRKISFSM